MPNGGCCLRHLLSIVCITGVWLNSRRRCSPEELLVSMQEMKNLISLTKDKKKKHHPGEARWEDEEQAKKPTFE